MITVKNLLTEKINPVHVALLSEPPTTTAVANLHHVLSQEGAKHIFHTADITPEIKSAYQNSGINHKHFLKADGLVKTIYDGINQTIKASKAPITLHVHPNQVAVVSKAVKETHPQLNIAVKSLPHNKGEATTPHPSIKKSEVKNIFKESFSIGDFVTTGEIEGEILNLHPKYATVISEGEEHRIWISDLKLSVNKPKRNQLFKESFIYKGYKTKHFNRSLSENFKMLAENMDDEYAMLACIKSCDYILGIDDTTIAENFNTVRIQIERLRRYSVRVGCQYIVERVISTVEEELLKYAVLEGINFTTTDRNMIGRVIAMTAGSINISADPTNTINQAVMKLRLSQLTPQGWALVGRLLNIATQAGIRWNKDSFSPGIQREMGLK